MYVFFIFFVCLATNIIGGFTDRIYQRLILGRDMLAEVQKVCVQKGDTKPLYARLQAEPLPLYVKVTDALLSESKEARLATLWRNTGEQLYEVLYGFILFRPGGFATWKDADVQQRLLTIYAADNQAAFNKIMQALELLHNQVANKLKTPHWWWHSLGYLTFKDSENELDDILTKSLDNLVNLRLLIDSFDDQAPFALFVPRVLDSIKSLNVSNELLKSIDDSFIKRRYYVWRTQILTRAIEACTPSLMPMAQKP